VCGALFTLLCSTLRAIKAGEKDAAIKEALRADDNACVRAPEEAGEGVFYLQPGKRDG
jgi:hypothetical protein